MKRLNTFSAQIKKIFQRSPKSAEQERGSVLIIAMVSITGLMTLGSLGVLAVQSSFASTSHHRFRSVALYAAESGLSAGKAALINNYSASLYWSNHVAAPGGVAPSPLAIFGSDVQPGEDTNVFTSPNTWYSVTVENNLNDPGYDVGTDLDRRVILRSEGHGPNGTVVVLESEVGPGLPIGKEVPCPSYAQKNINAQGSGHNPCLTNVDGSDANVVVGSPRDL